MTPGRRRTGSGLLLPLLAALLAGCGAGTPEAGRPPGERFDLRPRWEAGDAYRLQEERTEWTGRGAFPPAGDIERRAESRRREIHRCRLEVVEADGPRLLRARLAFSTSSAGEEGRREPTSLAGRIYEIENPLDRAATVAVVGPGGRRSPASPEDARRLRTSALVMAASLLPAEPVAVGESWKRGRDLRALADAGIRVRGMVPELEVVEGRETVPVAVVTCRSDLTSRAGPTAGADAVMRERVRFVLGERRISAYHLRREGQTPAAAGRPARWHLVSVDLSVTPVE